MNKEPIAGYGIAIIETSQMENVEYHGEDRFDSPQVGKLIKIQDCDRDRKFSDKWDMTAGDLVDKRIFWKKYADQDATFTDSELGDIVFIDLTKIVGYEL